MPLERARGRLARRARVETGVGTGNVWVVTLVRREDDERLESVQTKRLAARGSGREGREGRRGAGEGWGAESALSGL